MQQPIQSLKIINIFKANGSSILGLSNLIKGSRRENIIDNALYSFKSRRNLLSFKDLRYNGYHIETNNEGNEEYLYITSMVSGQKLVLENLPIFSYGLYYTTMRTI